MEPWEEKFKETCLGLKKSGKIITGLDYEGIVTFQKTLSCTEGHAGVYAGMEIDIGLLITAGNAIYCPECDRVTLSETVSPTFSTTPELQFLGILKRRQMERGTVEPITLGKLCPKCKQPTNVFLSNDLHGAHQWRICPNQDCEWPGEHKLQ